MYLGIDYGLKKIGLAYSEGLLAQPLGVVPNNQHLVENIAKLVPEPIDTIVIGIPNSIHDSAIRQWGETLQNRFNCTVIYQDEYDTTNEALRNQISAGVRKMKRRKDDATAATVILQRYLDNLDSNEP